MDPINVSSSSVFRAGLLFRRMIFVGVFIFSIVASARGQAPTPKLGSDTNQTHWHKYANDEFGFSLWYPDTYRLSKFDGICKDNEYRKYLLCLERQDDPDSSIVVTIIFAVPFFLEPVAGDVTPTREKIGQHDFYCGLAGSMGTEFVDKCIFNLKGKVLEFTFSPTVTLNTGKKTNPLESKVLRTFRVL